MTLTSLGTRAARTLATTTKSVPQSQSITTRWLLRQLPWVDVRAGSYRVNRRLTYALGDGRVSFTSVGQQVRVIPRELCELAPLRGYADDDVLADLANRFSQHEYAPGEVIVHQGQPAGHTVLVAHGKVGTVRRGRYGDENLLSVLADGDYFGDEIVADPNVDLVYAFTARAVTACTVLALPREAIAELAAASASLREQLAAARTRQGKPQNKHGEAAIELAAGHDGEPVLPGTFVDYDPAPREYDLAVVQTVLRVHTRVADLFNRPMDQVEQQLRLTVEALREQQENELVNNREFGLLRNADPRQRLSTRTGPPTPDDLDDLLSRRRRSRFLLAHPRAIAAFRRECSKRGLSPPSTDVDGTAMTAWRGVPLLPCDKIPVSASGSTSILVLRTGEDDQGVIGLHQTGIPHEHEPGLSVRFMGISERAVISYLVSAYFSVAILVPDALGVLEHVQTGGG